MTDNPGVVHLHVMVRPDQRAMLVSYAKHGRHISLSEALRAYLDETKVLMAIVAAGSRSSQQAGHTGQDISPLLATAGNTMDGHGRARTDGDRDRVEV